MVCHTAVGTIYYLKINLQIVGPILEIHVFSSKLVTLSRKVKAESETIVPTRQQWNKFLLVNQEKISNRFWSEMFQCLDKNHMQ